MAKLLSLDEQIKALEDELEGYSSAESDLESEDIIVIEKDKQGNPLRIFSRSKEADSIPPLPKYFLPKSSCGFPLHANETIDNSKKRKVEVNKKSVSFGHSDDSDRPAKKNFPGEKVTGLEHTVKELLRNYIPTSSYEKRPFWCRICQHQAHDEESFNNHKETEFHLLAYKEERKLSYCRLCKKQFTSPDQLKEHLSGAKHKELLEKVQAANVRRKKYC